MIFLYLHALCIRRNFIDRDKLTCFSSDFNHFVITHAQKWRYLHFRSEICCRLHLGEDLATRRALFLAIFSLCVDSNGYISVFSQNFDTIIQLSDPNFLTEGYFID